MYKLNDHFIFRKFYIYRLIQIFYKGSSPSSYKLKNIKGIKDLEVGEALYVFTVSLNSNQWRKIPDNQPNHPHTNIFK